jgi:hypothetical protein
MINFIKNFLKDKDPAPKENAAYIHEYMSAPQGKIFDIIIEYGKDGIVIAKGSDTTILPTVILGPGDTLTIYGVKV